MSDFSFRRNSAEELWVAPPHWLYIARMLPWRFKAMVRNRVGALDSVRVPDCYGVHMPDVSHDNGVGI